MILPKPHIFSTHILSIFIPREKNLLRRLLKSVLVNAYVLTCMQEVGGAYGQRSRAIPQ